MATKVELRGADMNCFHVQIKDIIIIFAGTNRFHSIIF